MIIEISNKRGWIKIVEAFISILLILAVVLIVINKGYIGGNNKLSEEIYQTELSILRSIQLDDTLRRDILISNKSGYPASSESPLPIVWEEFDDSEQRTLKELKNKILRQIPDYLDCIAKICDLNNACVLEEEMDYEIYAQKTIIAANYEVFSPRQLKLFCWVK
jgi:hypothetical protein